jgi:hypothetical protein
MKRSRNIWLGLLASFACMMVAPAAAQQQQQKPNILVIMGDDIGYWNISAYNRGQMGYRTPNIKRGRDLHRLLRPAILHRRPRRVHHRPGPDAHGASESWVAGSERRTIRKGSDGLGIYPDGMVEHDGQVGQLLKKLDDLGIADNDRDLHHRQRRRDIHLAGRRHHAVPRREEHQLGGQLSRAGDCALARSGAAAH